VPFITRDSSIHLPLPPLIEKQDNNHSRPPPKPSNPSHSPTNLSRRLPLKPNIHTPGVLPFCQQREHKSPPIPDISRNPTIPPPTPVAPSVDFVLRFPGPEIPALDTETWVRSGGRRRVSRYLCFEEKAIPCSLGLGGLVVVVVVLVLAVVGFDGG
jgi:hypothetical protein